MNLEGIKEKADFDEIKEGKVKKLKEETKELFKDFFSVMDKSSVARQEIMKQFVNQFVGEYVSCLEEKLFEVENPDTEITNSNYKTITAKYKGCQLVMSAINYDGEHIYINDYKDISVEFWFALPVDKPNYYVWKDNVDIKRKGIHDFGDNARTAYEAFVDYFSTVEDLESIISKVKINIEHFKDSFENIETCSLCIHKWGTDDTYINFEEFWKSIE